MSVDHTTSESQAAEPAIVHAAACSADTRKMTSLAQGCIMACIIACILSSGLAALDVQAVHSAEKPELTMLFPAGGQIGTSLDVTVQGKFPTWPLQVWTDSPHIQWTCLAEAGKLQAAIGPDAEPGLHWLRLFDANGASAARPYLIGQWPEASEVEPNDSVPQAQAVANLPFAMQGILNKQADVDLFAVQLAQGQLLAATLDSHKWLNSPADASLQILSSQGFVLEENLDHVGLDPYLEFTAPHADTYIVRVLGFPSTPNSTIAFSGGSDWVYRLRLETEPAPLASTLEFSKQSGLRAASTPVASGMHGTAAEALPVELPARLSGTIAVAKQSDFISFQAQAKAHYRLSVLARDCGSALDASLTLYGADGKELKRLDDVGQNRDPLLDWQAPTDATVFVSIGDFHRLGGPQYGYYLEIQQRKADFSLSVASDVFHTQVGQELEISISIVRQLDFAERLEVSLEGLPDSATCAAVESLHGGDSAAKVTLKLTSTEPIQMPLRIVARAVAAAAAAVPQSESAPSPAPSSAPDSSLPAADSKLTAAQAADGKPIWLSVAP